MKSAKKSYKNLIASIQLCLLLNKHTGKASFSRLNLLVLSFLCNRGFVASFKFLKEGSNGCVAFTLRRINGSLLIKGIHLPSNINNNKFGGRFLVYQKKYDLLRSFSSEFVVVSTTKGLMTANEAISCGVGGNVLCIIT